MKKLRRYSKFYIYLYTLFLAFLPLEAQSTMDLIEGGNLEELRKNLVPKNDIDEVNIAGQTALVLAVVNDDIDLVNFLLSHGANPNIVDREGDSPLIYAVRINNPAIIRTLIKNGADHNITNLRGDTAFSLAFESRDIDLIESLINTDNINEKLSTLNYPIHIGAALGSERLVNYFISLGARINVKDNNGIRPLDIALSVEDSVSHARIAQLLIEKDAERPRNKKYFFFYFAVRNKNYSKIASDGNTPLLESIEANLKGIFDLLIDEEIDINHQNNQGMTALHLAVRRSDAYMTSAILKKSPNVNERDFKGNTPLLEAVLFRGYEDIIPLLVDAGASTRLVNNDKDGLLHLSVLNGGSADNIAQLIDFGADINNRNAMGRTPLLESLLLKNYDIAKLLVRFDKLYFAESNDEWDFPYIDNDLVPVSPGTVALSQGKDVMEWLFPADISDIQNDDGMSLLHYAVLMDADPDILTFLLERKNNVNEVNRDGNTPLFFAIEQQRIEQAKFLKNNGADLFAENNNQESIFSVLYRQKLTFIDNFFKGTGSASEQNSLGENSLFYAIREDADIDILNLLISYGLNLGITNNQSRSLLHVAIDQDNKGTIRRLVASGVSLEIQDLNGYTPFLYVVSLKKTDFIPFLLSLGSNINARAKDGNTALHLATLNNDLESIASLIEFGIDSVIVNNLGQTAFFISVTKSYIDILSYYILVTPEAIGIRDEVGNTALHVAILNQNAEVAKLVLPLNDPFTLNSRGDSAFSLVYKLEDFSILGLLLERYINRTNTDGNTPLHLAILRKTPLSVVRYIAEYDGVNLRMKNAAGQTPLTLAMSLNSSAVVAYLSNL